MTDTPFVPDSFTPPTSLARSQFVLEPLGPQHNERDYAAWTSSVDEIHALPGWATSRWPVMMSLDENLGDLERHARDFANRAGFTYTVLDPDDNAVIGCVYIYPEKDAPGAQVESWVRADRLELDVPLAEAVAAWLARDWPFEHVRYAGRPDLSR